MSDNKKEKEGSEGLSDSEKEKDKEENSGSVVEEYYNMRPGSGL